MSNGRNFKARFLTLERGQSYACISTDLHSLCVFTWRHKSRQRKKEIWLKPGEEGTHRELGCLREYFMFICQQFRIIGLWWPTFTPLYQNCKESQRQKLISFNFCPEKWFPPPLSLDTTEVLAHRASSWAFYLESLSLISNAKLFLGKGNSSIIEQSRKVFCPALWNLSHTISCVFYIFLIIF